MGSPAFRLVLGLILPGLGHLASGRRGKGILFLVTILGTYAFGWGITRGECVSTRKHPIALIAQAGAAGPTAAAIAIGGDHDTRRWIRVLVESGDLSADQARVIPSRAGAPEMWHLLQDRLGVPEGRVARARWEATRRAHPRIGIGVLYTMVAGLLNLLVAFDAAEGRRGG
jgi:hypothetical protein